MPACACVFVYDRMSSPSYLPDSSLCVSLFLICIARYCDAVLTVGAGFVDKIAEVEQGGPGSQVLNEPLRKREKTHTSSHYSSQVQWRKTLGYKTNTLIPVIRHFSPCIPLMTPHPVNPQDSFHLFAELWLKHLLIH